MNIIKTVVNICQLGGWSTAWAGINDQQDGHKHDYVRSSHQDRCHTPLAGQLEDAGQGETAETAEMAETTEKW